MSPGYIHKALSDRIVLILFVILTVFVVVSVALAYTTVLGWDEGSYLSNAQYFIGEGENVSFQWPFFTPGLVSLVWILTGESVFAGRLVSVFFGAASLLVLYKLCEGKFENPIYPFAVFALAPLFVFWSSQIMTEAASFFFLFISLYELQKDRHLLAGVLIGFTVSVRYMLILFALAVFLNYLLDRNKDVWKYAAGGILGTMPFFIYSHFWHTGVFSIIAEYLSTDQSWSGFLPHASAENLRIFFYHYIPLLPAVFLGWRKSPKLERISIVIYSVFVFLFVNVSYYRYWLPILPFMVFIAYRGVDRKKFMVFSLIFLISTSFIMYDYYQRRATCRGELYEAHEFLMGEEGAVVSSVEWTITGYRVDRRVFAPWEDYGYFKRYNVTHILTDEELDYPEEAFYPDCGYRIYRLQEL